MPGLPAHVPDIHTAGAQDLPDGNFHELKKSGEKAHSKGHKEFFLAIT